MFKSRLSQTGAAIAGLCLLLACSDDGGGLPANAPCTSNADCADRICHSGMCAAAAQVGEGSPCHGHGDCKSYNCLGGVCRDGKLKDGQACIRDEECQSGQCNATGTCGWLGKDSGPLDASQWDLSRPDLAEPDLGTPDLPPPDKQRPDAPLPDQAAPDAPIPDQTPPDAPTPDASLCGNGTLDPVELCDGQLFGGKTCKTQGFTGGALKCTGCKLDTQGCHEIRDPAGIKVGTSGVYNLRNPRVASDGSGFYTVWGTGTSGIWGVMVDAAGKVGTQFKTISTPGLKQTPEVAFGTKDYLVVWRQGKQISGTLVSTAGNVGNPVGTTLVSNKYSVFRPSLVFDGSNYLLSYWLGLSIGNNSQVYARRVTAAGAPLNAAFKVGLSPRSIGDQFLMRPGAAFDGQNYFIAWSTKSNLYASRVSAAGKLLNSADIVVSAATGNQDMPAVASSGNETLLAYQDAQSGGAHINGLTVNKLGTLSKPSWVAVSNQHKCVPVAGYDGKHFLIVWNEGCTTGASYNYNAAGYLRGVRVDNAGKPVDAAPFSITQSGGALEVRPALAFGGGQYLVVWEDGRGSRTAVYGARLRFGKAP